MGCFNDPAWKVCGWWGGGGGGGVADTNYLYPARWGWINSSLGLDQYFFTDHIRYANLVLIIMNVEIN